MKGATEEVTATRIVCGIGLVFFLIALIGLNNPFLNVHFERQNQTYDVARHVFQTGWQGILVPEASFSMAGYTQLPFTVVRLEFPFFGLIGWPFASLFGDDRAVVRLIAVAFSLLSIYLIFRILRYWLQPASAILGAALWAFMPLVLHFGQVPMPDILCTAGLMLAFYLGLRGKLLESSVAFAFTVLAKETVLAFGLPVLVALLLARNIRSVSAIIRTTLLWGSIPSIALATWISLDRIGPPTPWTVLHTASDSRGPLSDFISPSFYFQSIGCLLPFGLGVIGVVGILFALRSKTVRVDGWLKLSIAVSSLVYFVFVIRRILEPQYFLPLLFWLVIAASFGFQEMLQKLRSGGLWRAVIVTAFVAHGIVAWAFTIDLKSSRVPDYPAIERAALLLPPSARVAVVDYNYQASPAVWLRRNVQIAGGNAADLDKNLPYLESMNFGYLMLLDLESRHRRTSLQLMSLRAMLATVKVIFTGQNSPEVDPVIRLANPASATRQYCDAHFRRLFESASTVLYSLPRR